MEIQKISLHLSDGSVVDFFNYPLNREFICQDRDCKEIDCDLEDILLDPQDYKYLYAGSNKIFLGFGTDRPSSQYRFPVWFPIEKLTSHIFVAGTIGSGKTSLATRLVAGGLKHFGTVIIGEIKSGTQGFAEGAAFTELSKYLSNRLNIPVYRWPRGNCWFNPLKYLKKRTERLAFLQSISKQLNTSSDCLEFADKAAEIASIILDYMTRFSHESDCTLRYFVKRLGNWSNFLLELKNLSQQIDTDSALKLNQKSTYKMLIEQIEQELTKRDFFRLDDPHFIGTRNAVMGLVSALSDEDVLYYSEPHERGYDDNKTELRELEIDEILYNRSLIVISQPQYNPSSKFVGPLFWDSLRRRVLELGIGIPRVNGKTRQKVLAILDETNELPVGELGSSLGFLREYQIGVVEISPYIARTPKNTDTDRWIYAQQTCQTFISLSPALEEVSQFIYNNLPNQSQPPFSPTIRSDRNNKPIISMQVNERAFYTTGDNPGVNIRALNYTGNRTALLYFRNAQGVFWIDLESSLLANLDKLLKDANSDRATEYAKLAVDYTLGLAMNFTVNHE